MTMHQYQRVSANLGVKEILANGSVEDVKASVQKYHFGGFGDAFFKSRTPDQYDLNGDEQSLKLDKHIVFMHHFLEDKDGEKVLRQGVKCLEDDCSGEQKVAKSICDNIGSLARHCIFHPKISPLTLYSH